MSAGPLTSSPHGHQGHSVRQLMLHVLLACVPGTAALVFFFGHGVLFNLVSLVLFALLFEALVLWIRQRPVLPALHDLSAIVTAVLLALALPPTAPWWLCIIAIFFAVVIGKHLYGGLGYNPFNPAMCSAL